MWTAEHVVRVLRERGELWEAAPGLIGLRGDVLGLHRALGQAIARLAAAETDEEWLVPAGLGFETLVRAGYFQSFPQWLTAASHLSDEPGVLEWVATDADPAAAARRALALHEGLAGRTFHLCAGAGALAVGDLLQSTWEVFARDAAWRRKALPRPVLADLATYALLERSIDATGDEPLQRALRGLSHFAPQLALPKRFETAGADALLGAPAPPVSAYWSRVVEHLVAVLGTMHFDRPPKQERNVRIIQIFISAEKLPDDDQTLIPG